MVGVAADRMGLMRDYAVEDTEESVQFMIEKLAALPHQDVLDFGHLAELLGYDRKVNTLDLVTEPRGYRMLSNVPRLPRLVVQKIVQNFGSVDEALAASDEELAAVDGVGPARAKEIREGVRRVRESVMADRFLNT